MNIMSNFLIKLIKIYQTAKRNKKPRCLHYPSCSNYAIMALKKYNLIKALKISINRIRDCHPFSSRSHIDYP